MSLMVRFFLLGHRCDRYRSEDYDDDDDGCYSFTLDPFPCEIRYEFGDRDSKVTSRDHHSDKGGVRSTTMATVMEASGSSKQQERIDATGTLNPKPQPDWSRKGGV